MILFVAIKESTGKYILLSESTKLFVYVNQSSFNLSYLVSVSPFCETNIYFITSNIFYLFIIRISDFFFHNAIFFNTLHTETKPSWLIYESNKTLGITNSKLFISFTINIILSYFLFLTIDSYFLITEVVGQIFISSAELTPVITYSWNTLQFFIPGIPARIPTKEAKVEMEAHPVAVEVNVRECSI